MNRSLSLSLVFAAMTTSTFATDRVVSPTGTYNTIGSAIAASSDGDRVLVEPGTYVENVGITRSISVLPLVEGARYTVQGTLIVTHSSAPMTVVVSGIRVDVAQCIGGPGRLDLSIVDSRIGSALLYEPYARVSLIRDSLPQGAAVSSGMLVGNTMGGVGAGNPTVSFQAGSLLADENWMVGNSFEFYPSGYDPPYLVDVQSAVPFHIENNFFKTSSNSSRFFRAGGSPPTTQSQSSILNNTFYRVNPGSLAAITVNVNINLVVANNAAINDGNPMVILSGFFPVTASNNLYGPTSWMNASTGQPVINSPLINAGNPDPRFLDLDLTTNDVGCYGGSNSRANFITPMGSAVVGFMNAPRVVSQGDAVNIQATGFDR